MMKKCVVEYARFGAVFLLLGIALAAVSVESLVSTSAEFNVSSPVSFSMDSVWAPVNITSGRNGTIVYIDNASTSVSFNNQSSAGYYLNGSYAALDSEAKRLACFGGTGSRNGTRFYVMSSSGARTNATDMLNNTNSTLMFIRPNLWCPPGRYTGSFEVLNATNSTENVSAYAVLDVPIGPENTFSESTQEAYFTGNMSGSGYHSYFFPNNISQNATSATVHVNWTTSSKDLDVFLMNSYGTASTRSANTSTSFEKLSYPLTSPALNSSYFEVRVYGNVSSVERYEGRIYFSPVDFTNSTNDPTPSSLFPLASLEPGQSSSQNFIVRNVAGFNVSGIEESSAVYRQESLLNRPSAGDYQVVVPSFTEKIVAYIEWNGGGDWNLYLSYPNGTQAASATGKSYYGNLSGTTSRERIEFTGINSNNDGLWNVSVAGSGNIYNVVFQAWVNASAWLSRNTTVTSMENDTVKAVNATVTVPVAQAVPGTYYAVTYYSRNNSWTTSTAFTFTLNAGMMKINDTFESGSKRHTDNIGYNKTFTFSIPYQNNGTLPVYFQADLSNLTYSGKAVNVSVEWPSSPVAAGLNGTINVTINVNADHVANTYGIYSGYLAMNMSNNNASRSSCPYGTFNYTLQLNLSNQINVNIPSVAPSLITTSDAAKNVTLTLNVTMINGSGISLSSENQVESIYLIPPSGSDIQLTRAGMGEGTLCTAGLCKINVTVPKGTPGGNYTLYANVAWNNTAYPVQRMEGRGYAYSLLVNESGLRLSADTWSTAEVNEGGSYTYYNATIRNYAQENVTNAEVLLSWSNCSKISISDGGSGGDGCSVSYSTYKFTVSVPNNSSKPCYMAWKFTTLAVEADTACSFNVNLLNRVMFGSNLSLSVTVKETSTQNVTTPPPGPNPGGDVTCSTNLTCASTEWCNGGHCMVLSCPSGYEAKNHECATTGNSLSITEYPSSIEVVQGAASSGTVKVKNTGTNSMAVKLNATAQGTAAGVRLVVTPASYTLVSGITAIFTVNVTASNATPIGNYTITYIASDNTSITDSETGVLSVVPTENTMKAINASYQGYMKSVSDLLKQFEEMKDSGFVSDTNLTITERAVNRTRMLLDKIKEAILAGDYIAANSYINDLNASIFNARMAMENLRTEQDLTRGEQQGSTMLMVVIGIAIACVVGFVIYMLLPPSGYHPTRGFKASKKAPIKMEFSVETLKQIKDLAADKARDALGRVKDVLGGLASRVKMPKRGIKMPSMPSIKKSVEEASLPKNLTKGYEHTAKEGSSFTFKPSGGYKYKYGSMKSAIARAPKFKFKKK